MVKIIRFLKPYKWAISLVLVLLFLQALADLYLPTILSDIVDRGIVNRDTSYILQMGTFMLLIAGVGALFSIGASFLSARISASFGKSMRESIFTRVESFSLQEFDQIGTSSLITRTTNDITQVQSVLVMMMRMMVSAPLLCIGGVMMAFRMDSKLSLIFFVTIPILVFTIQAIFRRTTPLYRSIQQKLDKLNLVVRESLTGIRVIRSFNRMNHEQARFDQANVDLMETGIQVNVMMATMMPLMMLLLNLSIIAIVWFGSIRIDHGFMQVGDLMAFIQYAMQIMFSLVMLSMVFVMIPRASASAARIHEVLEMVPTITDPKENEPRVINNGTITFQDVSFRYPGAEEPALSHISFEAQLGQVTAIIGGTGSGKSTLIHLIPRFYDVTEGRILIDQQDIRYMTQQSLRERIGFVSQKNVLFTGTVAENIRYGNECADDEEVLHAAETAQAIEFISKLPDGFDSLLEQGGANLSGGQKQRICIARALVRKPKIYVFDDSFSALDYQTDAKLRMALRSEIKEATVLIVAQRISTVIDADQIIVLDKGQIAGIGHHRELLNSCRVYREIVSSQLSEEELT